LKFEAATGTEYPPVIAWQPNAFCAAIAANPTADDFPTLEVTVPSDSIPFFPSPNE
jgi:hypothetical protein